VAESIEQRGTRAAGFDMASDTLKRAAREAAHGEAFKQTAVWTYYRSHRLSIIERVGIPDHAQRCPTNSIQSGPAAELIGDITQLAGPSARR
jgi:hypothetical protein